MGFNRRIGLGVGLALLVALIGHPIGATTYGPDEKQSKQVAGQPMTPEQREGVWGPRFAAFEGIIFQCAYDSDATLLAGICDRAETEINLLAAGNDVPLIIVEPNNWFQLGMHAARNPTYVTLEYSLQTVDGTDAQTAISGHLQFKVSYSGAIEQDSKSADFDAKPRPGELVIWEDSLIGVGSRSGFVDTFSSAAEQLLKKGLTLFLKYADPQKDE